MTVPDLNEAQLRYYYRDTLSGDGVCTITEDEFVAEYLHFKSEGKQIALKKFAGLPTSVDMKRSFMISDAQKIGQKTYQPVILAGLEDPHCPYASGAQWPLFSIAVINLSNISAIQGPLCAMKGH